MNVLHTVKKDRKSTFRHVENSFKMYFRCGGFHIITIYKTKLKNLKKKLLVTHQ